MKNSSPPNTVVRRHLTAISRNRLSVGARAIVEAGLLDNRSLLDLGCGRGDDVRRLAAAGCHATGWDPHFFPDVAREVSDVVLLSYVLNTIEVESTRVQVLEEAWRLARHCLVVSVRLHWERGRVRGEEYEDGVLTGRRTFQHLFRNEELLALIRRVTQTHSVLVRPGVVFCFKQPSDRLLHLAQRWMPDIIGDSDQLSEIQRATLFLESRGRLPSSEEIGNGSSTSWRVLATRAADPNRVRASARAATLDTLGFLALERFHGPLACGTLPPSTQRDIRAFIGTFKEANFRAERLLRQLGDQSLLR